MRSDLRRSVSPLDAGRGRFGGGSRGKGADGVGDLTLPMLPLGVMLNRYHSPAQGCVLSSPVTCPNGSDYDQDVAADDDGGGDDATRGGGGGQPATIAGILAGRRRLGSDDSGGSGGSASRVSFAARASSGSGCGGDGAAMTADGDGRRGGEATPKPKRVALIGAKKAQNLNIMLAHFGKLAFAALARAVNELDERGVMGLEGATNLLDFVPARDETVAVRRYISDGGDTALLGKVSSAGSWFVAVPPRCRMEPYPVSPDPSASPPPTVWCHEAELFTLAISEVDSLGERLVAMKAKCTFDEEAGALRASLSALRAACRALRSASGAAALRAFLGK